MRETCENGSNIIRIYSIEYIDPRKTVTYAPAKLLNTPEDISNNLKYHGISVILFEKVFLSWNNTLKTTINVKYLAENQRFKGSYNVLGVIVRVAI